MGQYSFNSNINYPKLYKKTFWEYSSQSCSANEVYFTLINVTGVGQLDFMSVKPNSIGVGISAFCKVTIDGNIVLWWSNLQSDNKVLGLTIPNAYIVVNLSTLPANGQAAFPNVSKQARVNYYMSNPLFFDKSLKIEIAQDSTGSGQVDYEYKYTTI